MSVHLLQGPFVTFMELSVSAEIPTKWPWWSLEVSGNMLCFSIAWENMCASWDRAAVGDAKAWLIMSEQWRNAVCWFFTYLHGHVVLKLTAQRLVAMDVPWQLEKALVSSARVRGAGFGRDHTGGILKGAGVSPLRCPCLLSVLDSSSFWVFQE